MWKRIFGGLFYVFMCSLLLGIGVAAGWISKSPVLRALAFQKTKDIFHIPTENPFHQDTVTLLVLGCDEDRYFGGKQITRHQARSDMMLLCKLDFKNRRITGISIPRDTLVASDGYAEQKINAYHVKHNNNIDQNNQESLLAVETLLPGITVDKVMALNFDAFKEMVDAVGGVNLFVPINMNYDDVRGHLHIHLKQGYQHLDGDKSEQFVRMRHSDSDFDRTGRQREFVLAFKSALEQHWTQLPQVADKAVELTANALSEDQIAYIADFAQKIGGDNIQMGMLPVVDADDGAYDLRLDERKAPEVLRQYHFLDDDDSTRVSLRS